MTFYSKINKITGINFHLFLTLFFVWTPSDTYAESVIPHEKRLSLARDFVQRIKKGNNAADQFLITQQNRKITANILPDGEELFFQPLLLQDSYPRRFKVQGIVSGHVKQQKLLLSLKDFAETMQVPIHIDMENKTASGWYIRENKTFELDIKNKQCTTDNGEFEVSDNIVIQENNNDFLIPAEELEKWLNLDMDLRTDSQELIIKTTPPFPVQEHYARKRKKTAGTSPQPSTLPRGDKEYQIASIPVVDIATNTTYRKKRDDKKGTKYNTANIQTSGDFAKGTLTTQTLLDDTDRLRNIRANYKQESNTADLLGPIKARRFELGDILATQQNIGGSSGQELGIRLTNTDPLRSLTQPTTSITGTGFTGWDVELYRNNQFVEFKTLEDDGFYSFDDIDLFTAENNFRLIFYGPQGEVREKEIFVPVDNKRLSQSGGVYDVSLSLEGKNAYTKETGMYKDKDLGTLNMSALYEHPLPNGAVSAGFETGQDDGTRDYIAHVGLSTTFNQFLINANTAIDDEAEFKAELTARRKFDKHNIINKASWTSPNFDTLHTSGTNDVGIYSNTFRANGPIPAPFNIGNKPHYNFSVDYSGNTDGDTNFSTTSGISTGWKYLNTSNQLTYATNNSSNENETLTGMTTLSGNYKNNFLRLYSQYDMMPEYMLKRLKATYKREITKDIDIDVDLEHQVNPTKFSELTAKLDWQAGFARISPSISYNSEQDFFAGLRTRFSLLKEPQSGDIRFYDRGLTNNGGLSAFVFLDKDGNGEFNGDDEPLEDVLVRAPQNGGRERTDKNGIALFTRMREMKKTDIVLDNDSLRDPAWVSTFEGISVLPRKGYIAEVSFPVHMAGELDGTVYATASGEQKERVLKNITLHLYNAKGRIEQSAITDPGGFYYFSRIPPGRYLLMIDERNAEEGHFMRPDPQQIEILYDGAVFYGNDLYVESDRIDIPSIVKTDLTEFKERNTDAAFDPSAHQVVLNLGEYKSQLLMSLVWYRLQKTYKESLHDAQLFVAPAQSKASPKSGKHTLRVGLYNEEVSRGYDRCHTLIEHGLFCKVEIYPANEKQANTDL